MRDLVEELQRYGRAAERAVPPTPFPAARRRHRSRRVAGLAAAIVAVAALGVVLLVIDRPDAPIELRTDSSEDPSGRSPSDPEPTGPTPTTAPATRTLRTSPVVVVADEEYLVWAGEAGENDVSQRADGFAVDLASGAVRTIPVAPIDPRSGATGVWTGEELIVCCGTGQADGFRADTRSAAAWDPATSLWRELARPPASIARSYAAAVWTGDVMVVVAPGSAVASYHPATDRWVEQPAPPALDRIPEAVWTGSEVVVWDSTNGSGLSGAGLPAQIADRGWRWTPGDEAWTPLPELPEGARTRMGSVVWTGSELVVWGQSTADDAIATGARWRPGDTGWRPATRSPQGPLSDPYEGTPGSQGLAVTDDGKVLVRDIEGGTPAAGTFLYDPAVDRWTRVDVVLAGFHPRITVVGDAILVPDEARPIVGSLRG